MRVAASLSLIALLAPNSMPAQSPKIIEQAPNTWVKRSPLKNAPLSPLLGYEGSFGYDPKAKLVIRWAGHNQGGGGEQNAETWTFDPVTAKWTLKEPNTSPPGACCNAQNLFDPVGGRFLRFPAFSGSHGWHWFRENYLNNSSVWSYDLEKNTWRDMRPVPTPHPAPLRCASWDSHHQLAVIFGGEGASHGTIVYDPYDNTWSQMHPKQEPAGRSAGNMAFHNGRGQHILFGSQFSDDPFTWSYSLGINTWHGRKLDVQPPTDKNDAVLAYDEVNGVIVASVRAPGKAVGDDGWHYETWVFDAVGSKYSWKKMNPNVEPPGGGQRRRIMVAIPDQNVILMENYVNPPQRVPGVEREQQIWTYRYEKAKDPPKFPPPTSVRVETTEKGVRLFWQGGTEGGWVVMRHRGFKPWTVDWKKDQANFNVRADETSFEDNDLNGQNDMQYKVAAMVSIGNNGFMSSAATTSVMVRTQPRLVEDVIASVHSTSKVELTWPAAAAPDVVGYHVERAPVEVFTEDQIVRLRKDTPPLEQPSVGAIKAIGKFETLTKTPIKETTYTDVAVDLTKPREVKDPIYRHRFAGSQLNEEGKPYRFAVYAYRVRAVNRLGVSSGAGPYVLTIPSGPQHLFSQEDGTKCRLIWAKNPEAGLKGYRVYRMESPRINGAGQKVTRVTAKPIAKNRFVDENAGKDTARFWIVAVDALGQEGYPSAPTWHERQYKKHYLSFTGEWHQ